MWAFISLLPANEVTNSKVSELFLNTYLCVQVKRIKMYNDLVWKNTIYALESSIVGFHFVRESDWSAPDSRNQYFFER